MEYLFSSDLPYLLRGIPTSLLVGSDFNSILTNMDVTGHHNYSRAPQELVRGFDLVDMWETSQERATYTHYTSRGASRIDRIYASRNLSGQKSGRRVYRPPSSGATDIPLISMRRGRIYWMMNTAFLRDETFQGHVRQRWAEWTKQTKKLPPMVLWWERVVKVHIKRLHTGRD